MPSLLNHLPAVEIPVGLADAVIGRIRDAEIRGLHLRIVFSFVGLLLSVGSIVLSWSAVLAEVTGSSFLNLIHLAVTDSDVVFANIGSSANSLLESFPVMSVLLVLIALFCLVASIGLFQTLRKIQHTAFPHLA